MARVMALEEAASTMLLRELSAVLDPIAAQIGQLQPVTAAAVGPGEARVSIDDLSAINSRWGMAVDRTVLPWFGGVFEAGGNAAQAQLAGIGVVVPHPDRELMNYAARQYLAEARPRFTALGDQAWTEARDQLLTGFQEGEGIDKLRSRVRSVTDLSKVQADQLARTEVISASNAGAVADVDLLGEDAPPYRQWLSTLDTRTRPSHVAADGQVVKRGEPFQVGMASLRFPGDPYGPPQEVIRCRCTVLFLDSPEPLEPAGRQEGGMDTAEGAQEIGGPVDIVEETATVTPTKIPETDPAELADVADVPPLPEPPPQRGAFSPIQFKPPKGYSVKDLVDYYLRTSFGEAFSNLTSGQRRAVRRYTSAGYKAMNRELRRGNLSDSVRNSVNELDTVFNTPAAVLPDDLTLYRGVKGRFADQLEAAHKNRQLVGSVFEDPAYMSTSPNRQVTQAFGGRQGALFHIEARSGQKALGVPTDTSSTFGENEIILPRGSRLLVTRSERRNGVLNVYLRVLDPGETP